MCSFVFVLIPCGTLDLVLRVVLCLVKLLIYCYEKINLKL